MVWYCYWKAEAVKSAKESIRDSSQRQRRSWSANSGRKTAKEVQYSTKCIHATILYRRRGQVESLSKLYFIMSLGSKIWPVFPSQSLPDYEIRLYELLISLCICYWLSLLGLHSSLHMMVEAQLTKPDCLTVVPLCRKYWRLWNFRTGQWRSLAQEAAGVMLLQFTFICKRSLAQEAAWVMLLRNTFLLQ